jgi:hypothetical protein
MECGDGTEISSRFCSGRKDGIIGSLATWRVFGGDRAGVCEAVIVYLFRVALLQRIEQTAFFQKIPGDLVRPEAPQT